MEVKEGKDGRLRAEEMWEMEEREMRDDPALEECERYDINTFSVQQKSRKIW